MSDDLADLLDPPAAPPASRPQRARLRKPASPVTDLRPKFYGAAERAGLPREVADDFYNVTTGIESGNRHYRRPGVVLTSPVDPKDGQRAIGISQIKPGTAARHGKYNLYDLDDNIEAGLMEFYSIDRQDPVARRIGYFSGSASGALKYYRRTGRIPRGGDFTGTTFQEYIDKSLPAGPPSDLSDLLDSSPAVSTAQPDDLSDLLDTPVGKDPYAQYEADGTQSIADLLDPVEPRERVGITSTSVRVSPDEAEDTTDSLGQARTVRPIDFPAAPERSLAEKIAGGAQVMGTFKENAKYEQPENSAFGVNEFVVKVPGDSRRYPTPDEVRDAILNSSPDLAAADKKYRAETGRSIGHLIQLDMNAVRKSFNPQSNAYEISVNATNNLARLASAYLSGDLQTAQDEGARIKFRPKKKGARLRKMKR